MDSPKNVILLSIHPEYVNLIKSGGKKIEFRKKSFSKSISKVLVYSTSPISKIIGYFNVLEIIKSTPTKLWKDFSRVGGITEDNYFKYYSNAEEAVGIKIGEMNLFENEVDISVLGTVPPQSFKYLSEFEFKKVCNIGYATVKRL